MPCRININPKNNSITHRSVPSDSFPYITAYATIINRLTNEKTQSRDLMDIVNRDYNYKHYQNEFKNKSINFDSLCFGEVNTTFGGYGQHIIEFDIWNNEPGVTYNFTKSIYEDAENCKVYITNNNYDFFRDSAINFEIKKCFEDNKFKKLDKFEILNGNFSPLKKGILSGKTDHTIFQISVNILKINKPVCKDKFEFNVCFEYETKHEIKDFNGKLTNKVKLNFPCYISLTNKNINIDIDNFGTNYGVTNGKLEGLSVIKNSYPTSIINIKNSNELTLYDKYVIENDIYNCFLPNGIYDFEIITNNIRNNFNNVKICNGINPYYSQINYGQIYKIIDDTTIILNNRKRYIQVEGKLYDEYNNILDNAEILITSYNKLLLYYITNGKGYYRFLLPTNVENYDIRIRRKDKNIKILNNFKYNPNESFIKQIQEKNNIFINGFSFKEV